MRTKAMILILFGLSLIGASARADDYTLGNDMNTQGSYNYQAPNYDSVQRPTQYYQTGNGVKEYNPSQGVNCNYIRSYDGSVRKVCQ